MIERYYKNSIISLINPTVKRTIITFPFDIQFIILPFLLTFSILNSF